MPVNRVQRNNSSGVPGIRLRRRAGHLFVVVDWTKDGLRGATEYPVKDRPLLAVRRALERRRRAVGADYWRDFRLTPMGVWRRISRAIKNRS